MWIILFLTSIIISSSTFGAIQEENDLITRQRLLRYDRNRRYQHWDHPKRGRKHKRYDYQYDHYWHSNEYEYKYDSDSIDEDRYYLYNTPSPTTTTMQPTLYEPVPSEICHQRCSGLDLLHPVCCNDIDYINICYADCECINIHEQCKEGPCSTTLESDILCPDQCPFGPSYCTDLIAPVCCDGNDEYMNLCIAECEGCHYISSCVNGPCEVDTECEPINDSEECNKICSENKNDFDINSVVCCNDGNEYNNLCAATICACIHDVSAKCKNGPCPSIKTGHVNYNNFGFECGMNCDVSCNRVWNPVCCNDDGMEYINQCNAECHCKNLLKCQYGECGKRGNDRWWN